MFYFLEAKFFFRRISFRPLLAPEELPFSIGAAKLQPFSFRRRFLEKKLSKNQRVLPCLKRVKNRPVLWGCKGKTFTQSAINFLEEIFLKTVFTKPPSRTQRTRFAAEAGAKVGSSFHAARLLARKISPQSHLPVILQTSDGLKASLGKELRPSRSLFLHASNSIL